MDQLLKSFAALILPTSIVSSLNKWKSSKDQISIQKSPPGPWKLPIIGNLHHLVGSPPHHALKRLAEKHGALMQLQLGETSFIVVSSARLAKEIMRTHDLAFSDRPELLVGKILSYNSSDIVFSPYGEYWREMRKICSLELLSPKRVQSFGSVRTDEALRMVLSIQGLAADGERINLKKEISLFTSSMVCRAAFGEVCPDDQNDFVKLMNESVPLTGGFDVSDLFPSLKLLHHLSPLKPRLLKAQQEFDRILDNIINHHIENRNRAKDQGKDEAIDHEDLLDVLLRIQESNIHDSKCPLSKDNIKAVIFDIFTGGTETSSTTLEWAMSEMIRHPNALERAQTEVRNAFMGKKTIEDTDIKELKYLKLVIKETLRLHPPVPLLVPRECREECQIDGYAIPLKTRVLINAWAIGRNPEYWDDPESFRPERFEESSIDYAGNHFEYLPFGAGRRICPGISFALPNMELPLALLLYHFDWKLPDDVNSSSLDMSETCGMTAARKHDLVLMAISKL